MDWKRQQDKREKPLVKQVISWKPYGLFRQLGLFIEEGTQSLSESPLSLIARLHWSMWTLWRKNGAGRKTEKKESPDITTSRYNNI